MSENLIISSGDKAERWATLLPQVEAMLEGEADAVAAMANVAAMIHYTFDNLWTGFYRVVADALVLGPFQGPLACVRIKRGRGVCGTAWAKAATLIVPDVEQFPGHIACSSLSRSEIVVPIIGCDGEVKGVIDIDSEQLGTFDATDAAALERIAALLAPIF